MKISLITISKNNLSGLRKTLENALKQNYDDVEFIVVDGESTDGSQEYLKSVSSRVKVIEAPAKGVYNAINVGIAKSTGTVIGMLNGGDTFSDENVLKTVANTFEKYADLGFLYGDVHYATNKTYGISRYYSGEDCSLLSLKRGFAPPHPSLYMERNLFGKVGMYKENYENAGDFEMFLRLFLDSKIKSIYLPFDMVEMAPGGISSTWRNRLYTNNIERMRALSENGLKRSWFRILMHYYYILKSTLWRKNKKTLRSFS